MLAMTNTSGVLADDLLIAVHGLEQQLQVKPLGDRLEDSTQSVQAVFQQRFASELRFVGRLFASQHKQTILHVVAGLLAEEGRNREDHTGHAGESESRNQ